MNGQSDGDVDYKRKYRNLKRKLKFLIYEQECFQEELRKAQRKLLKVSRDKSFLLDRLLQYENVDEDSSDSDATASSENSEGEGPRPADLHTPKRKKSPSPSSGLSMQMSTGYPLQTAGTPSSYLSSMTSPPYAQFPTEYLAPEPGLSSVKSEKSRREKRPKAPKPKKPKMPLTPSSHSEMAVGGLPYHPRTGASLSALSSPKLPAPTILSAVPQQMFSDTGEGSGEDPLDGDDDDDLVIDIPE